jgi:hypothetical protein
MIIETEDETAISSSPAAPAENSESRPEDSKESGIVTEMFPSKKKINSKTEDPADPKDPKSDKTAPQNAENPPPEKKQYRDKTNERIRKLSDEKNSFKSEAEDYRSKYESAVRKIQELESKQNPTIADQIKYVNAQESISEYAERNKTTLKEYAESIQDPSLKEEFYDSYDTYIPILKQHDPATVEYFSKYPEMPKMLSKFFDAVNSGQLNIQAWVQSPAPIKKRCLNMLASEIEAESKPVSAPATVQRQTSRNSITPDLDSKHSDNTKDNSKGSTFYRIMNS